MRVATADGQGAPVVGKLLVSVGRHARRDAAGRTAGHAAANQAEPTERPFEPATKAALADQLRSSALTGFQSKETRRYLYLYNCSEPFAEAASRILETMFRGVVGLRSSPGDHRRPARSPVDRHHFSHGGRNSRNFVAMPEDTVAYYDVLTNRVVMYEESQLWRIKPELATCRRPSPRSLTRAPIKSCTTSASSSDCRSGRCG